MILFRLFAHHKGGGSTKNGRDSNAKRLGIKANDGQSVSAGSIIVRHIHKRRQLMVHNSCPAEHRRH